MAEAAVEQPNTWLLAGPSQPLGDPSTSQNAAEVAAVDGTPNDDADEPCQLFSRSFTYIVNGA